MYRELIVSSVFSVSSREGCARCVVVAIVVVLPALVVKCGQEIGQVKMCGFSQLHPGTPLTHCTRPLLLCTRLQLHAPPRKLLPRYLGTLWVPSAGAKCGTFMYVGPPGAQPLELRGPHVQNTTKILQSQVPSTSK